MDQQKVRALLTRYRLGQCTEQEAAWVEEWYGRTAIRVTGDAEHTDLEARKRVSWKRIQTAVRPETVFEARLRPARMLYLAASVAAVLCLGFFWLIQNQTRPKASIELISLATRPGELASYVLPDSSVVTLNGGSLVQYPKVFSAGKREIELKDGEAFFDVRHDPSRPFTVSAGRTKTQVLGTAFSIRAYTVLKDVQVTVSRGKVGVSNAQGFPQTSTAFLLPGDRVIVDNRGHYRKARVNIQEATSWIKGLLDFDNEDLTTIALLLEKKFNVHVRIADSQLKDQRLTARFKADETLDDILSTLGVAGNFSFRHATNQVLISMNEH
jgi:transmembrane sensor